MVDLGLGGRGEMHVRRTHAAARHTKRLPPPNNMLQEDEIELNVMDFVETEYMSDAGQGGQGRPGLKRKKVRVRPQGSQGKGSSTNKSKREVKPPGEAGKTAHKRRKRKHTSRLGEQSNSTTNYPYAAFLKKLCDKVGSSQGCPPSLPSRIFNQLRHIDVHYPYASLLQALHRHAGVSARSANSPSTERASQDHSSTTQEVAKVMKNLRYRVTSHGDDSQEDTGDPVAPFSAVLMAIVMKEQMCSSPAPEGSGHSVGSIGEILRKEMPHSKKDDLPPSELSSASLLQKLSLSAEKDMKATKGTPATLKAQKASTWTSTESSQSEGEDFDWRPTHSLSKKVSKDTAAPVKRKSIRKKTLSCDPPEQPNTSQADLNTTTRGTLKTGLQQCSSSLAARTKLMQFIMSRQQGTQEKRSKRARKRAKVTKKKGKRKDSEEDCTVWVTNGIVEDHTTPIEEESSSFVTGEPQSLLKEYLLKPAGEEVVPSENCDIPKLETNFLFSRLLQNFKCLAESNQPEEPTKKSSESPRGPSILRGMLVASTPTDDSEHKASSNDHQNTSSSSSSSEQQKQASTSPPVGEPLLRVKLEENIKVECDEEEIVCKVECEEDSFECHVCHLQFSSLTDLSNHQVLFHCSEEPQPPASHRLLGCSVEGLAGGVMQGKQPA